MVDGRHDRGNATRARLIAEARALFASKGYAAVSTQEILEAAGVTRGALYHHFTDKQALFDAVLETVCAEVSGRLMAETVGATSYLDGLIKGCEAQLRVCADPEILQIYLIDAAAVVGWRRWWEIDMRYAMGDLRVGIEAACDERGVTDRNQRDAMLTLLSGALNQAALTIADSTDPAGCAEALIPTVRRMIEGLFVPV
ncbi:TetR/AcrR family transcriptional regulator [Phenylobacterium zucineum]|nr:TetR/AcrR family transcriptional regulator [Phenylobacterium zucineum]